MTRSSLVLAALLLSVTLVVTSNLEPGAPHSPAGASTGSTTTTTTPVGEAASPCSPTGWTASLKTGRHSPDAGLALSTHHCRIAVIGDSLGEDVQSGVAREFAADHHVVVHQDARKDTGLSNPWFYDWPARLPPILRTQHPQIVVIIMGANDIRNLHIHGSNVAFGTTAWRRDYAALVVHLATEATSTGAAVLWLGLPVMRPDGYRQAIALVNRVDRRALSSLTGVTFLPTEDMLAGPDGKFRAYGRVNGVRQELRSPDGIHLYPAGDMVVGTRIVGAIRSIYGLAVRPSVPATLSFG